MIASLAPCFADGLAPYAGMLRAEADARALPGRALLDQRTVGDLVARFAQSYPGADRRAVVSFWTQWYFGALIVPTAAAILQLERDLPVDLGSVRLRFRQDGTPAAFLLAHEGTAFAPRRNPDRFGKLLDGHVAPLIAHLAQAFGVSRRLLWTNAAMMLDWTSGQVAGAGRAADGPLAECRARLEDALSPCGRSKNPLCGRLARPCGGEACRRVCCLRYRLPGVPSCGALCPLSEAQRATETDAPALAS